MDLGHRLIQGSERESRFLSKSSLGGLNAKVAQSAQPSGTSVVSALRKGGVGSKLFATDGSPNRAGVISSVARRDSQGFT